MEISIGVALLGIALGAGLVVIGLGLGIGKIGQNAVRRNQQTTRSRR